MRESSSISICTGNASKLTSTIGGLDVPRASHTRASPDVTRLEAFDVNRKRKPNRIGASPSTEQIDRRTSARAYAAANAAPSPALTAKVGNGAQPRRRTSVSANTAARPPISTRWTICPARRLASVASGLDGQQDQSGDEQHRQREGDDAPARDVVRGEERGIATEDVEQRLGEGQRGECDQVHSGAPERAQPTLVAGDRCGGAHRGRAW